MTAATQDRVPAQQGGYPALSRLVRVSQAEFGERYWGRCPLVSPADDLPLPFSDLLDQDAVDELVSRRALRAPFVRVAKEGATLPERAFTQGAGVGAAIGDQVSDDRLLALFGDGATIVLQALHRSWEPVLGFCQELSAELGHPVQANAYVTPAQNTGFSDHYDVHDVFVLQIEGRKHWRIHDPVRPSPLRSEPWSDHREAVAQSARRPADLEVTLAPGDCLYLPRGYLHAATALGAVSTHMTLGVHSWTRRHLAEDLTAAALRLASEDEAMRQSLPAGVDVRDPAQLAAQVDLVRAALRAAVDQISVDELSSALSARHRSAQRAAPLAVLAQARAADNLVGTDRLRLRPHLSLVLDDRPDGTLVMLSRADDVVLEESDRARVEGLVAEGESSVADLGPDLARRLVFAGVVVSA